MLPHSTMPPTETTNTKPTRPGHTYIHILFALMCLLAITVGVIEVHHHVLSRMDEAIEAARNEVLGEMVEREERKDVHWTTKPSPKLHNEKDK